MANDPRTVPKVAIIVVTYNAPEFVRLCLESVRRYTTVPYRLIVVDNASEEPTREYLRGLDGIELIANEKNVLWCEGCNIGLRTVGADTTHVCLLNSDMEVRRADWLQRMINVLDSSEQIALVGTAHDRVRIGPTFGSPDGQCFVFKRHLLDEIGLLDSERLPWNGADIDYAARAFARGYIYKIMPKNPELVVHYHGMSRRAGRTADHGNRLQQDIDVCAIIGRAGLTPRRYPHWLWEIVKRLPGWCFFELTEAEKNIARGGSGNKGDTYYGQKLKNRG